MKITFNTKSGSTYVIDDETMLWERQVIGEGSVFVRTKTGSLSMFPAVVLGKPVFMIGPPLAEGASFRFIQTTPVTAMIIEDAGGE